MTSSEITLKVKGPGDNIKKIIFYKPMSTTKEMFNNCYKIIEINLSKFNTSLVTDMNNMFAWCSSLYSLDLSNFNTSKVINMGSMFYRCIVLNSLNLSNFNTLKVNNTAIMFADSLFIYLNLSSFDMTNVKSIYRIFLW